MKFQVYAQGLTFDFTEFMQILLIQQGYLLTRFAYGVYKCQKTRLASAYELMFLDKVKTPHTALYLHLSFASRIARFRSWSVIT
jgi:hypothetical protein